MTSRKQMIQALVDARYPAGRVNSRIEFAAGLAEQSNEYLTLAYNSLPGSKPSEASNSTNQQPIEGKPTAKCPRCNFNCQQALNQPGKFYCGFCTETDGAKYYFEVKTPF